MDIEQMLFNTYKENGHLIKVWLFPAEKRINDPYDMTTTQTFLNPIPVDAVVMDLTPESLRWKYTGKVPLGSKKIICPKKYKALFKLASKIKIKDDYYKTWQDDSKSYAILEREAYIMVILSSKSINIDNQNE